MFTKFGSETDHMNLFVGWLVRSFVQLPEVILPWNTTFDKIPVGGLVEVCTLWVHSNQNELFTEIQLLLFIVTLLCAVLTGTFGDLSAAVEQLNHQQQQHV